MDKLSKLHALLGEGQVSTDGDAESSPWNYAKPKHLYEGTDSEDDEMIIRGSTKPPASYWNQDATKAPESMSDDREAIASDEYQLQLGDLAGEHESFCPWLTVKKYPYTFVGIANRTKVAEGFFDGGKLFDRPWDFFYIHRHGSDSSLPAILLIPTRQLDKFLRTINQTLNTQLAIPTGGSNGGFQVTFEDDGGTPRPRYLGHSTTRDMAENLRAAIPPSWFKGKDEPSARHPSSRSLAAFKAKIDLLSQAAKGKKVVSKERQKTERIAQQQSWSHSTKRVQRYLGIRQAVHEKQAGVANSHSEWGSRHEALKAVIPRSADFNPDTPAPYDQEGEIVFVCIDVEANERAANQITEIGIATLDTRELKTLVPGERGLNWHSKIRARHFRINEYKHIVNRDFVAGCPDRFEFGESEFINLKDAPQAVAACFKPPFSNPDVNVVIDQNEPKRNVILVGHGVGADISYLKSIGYDVHNLSNLQELVDTALMWQSLKRDVNPRNLGSVLAELDIISWNLHNGGNDAVYTLQAMIGISVKQLYEREKRKEVRDQEKKARVEETIKEAMQNALDREEGWRSGGENSDGGAPVAPVAPVALGTKKQAFQQARHGAQYTQGPWRPPTQNSGNSPHNQRNDGSWQRALMSGPHPSASNGSWREQKTSVEAPTLGCTPTASVPNSNPGSRQDVDLVDKTALFTIESDEPTKEQKRG